MAEVTVVGDTLADISFTLPPGYAHRVHLEQALTLPLGGKLPIDNYQLTAGGSGANVAVALRRADLATSFITGLGRDALGDDLANQLHQAGLNPTITSGAKPTSLSVVLVSRGERIIITAHATPYRYLESPLPQSGHLHIGPLHRDADEFYAQLISHVAKTSQTFSFNPSGEFVAERPRHFMIALKSVDILFVNQEEAAALSRLPKRTGGTELVRALRRLGPKVVVVTCGAKGAFVGEGEYCYHCPATGHRDEIVDTTGAGDAFTSGFLAGWLTGEGQTEYQLLNRATSFGSANSAAVITVAGAQNGLLDRAGLEHSVEAGKLKKVEA